MTNFTFEEFAGYNFECESTTAPVGFKHVCHIFDKDNQEVTSTSIQYLNRTWERFQFESVLSKAKEKLNGLLSDNKEPEIDTDFLNTLVNECYITDYGVLYGTDDEYAILMDSWEQVEGVSREWVQGKGYQPCELKPSVYNKLVELAKQGRLKPSISYTLLNTDYVFTDEYIRCDECGKICNTSYGEARYYESADMVLCTDCMMDDDEVIEGMIESAQDNFKEAIPVEVSEEKLNELGYSKVNSDDVEYSTSYEMWGEKRFGYDYISTESAIELCQRYNGFAKLESVQQFDTTYSLYVPTDALEAAKTYLDLI